MAPMGDEEILRVEGVSKQFDGMTAVSEVSFGVRRGEIFGLLGPNGAGKTTLIRMILGIFRPDSGTIHLTLDDAIETLRKEAVGYLPEERGLYDERRVGETLRYFALLHGMDPRRAHERALYWLDRLGLDGHLNSRVKELSKGMQQKIQFVIAVLHDPELVVLDEPFSGLDPPSQDLFRDIIKELSEGGMTVLLSSHQMNLVESLCDRVFLIHQGRRVLYGDLDRIKREHGEDIVRLRYREADPEQLRAHLSQNGQVRITALDRSQAELVLPKGMSPNTLLRQIVDALEVEELTITKPSLHRLFVEIVGKGVP